MLRERVAQSCELLAHSRNTCIYVMLLLYIYCYIERGRKKKKIFSKKICTTCARYPHYTSRLFLTYPPTLPPSSRAYYTLENIIRCVIARDGGEGLNGNKYIIIFSSKSFSRYRRYFRFWANVSIILWRVLFILFFFFLDFPSVNTLSAGNLTPIIMCSTFGSRWCVGEGFIFFNFLRSFLSCWKKI